MEKQQTIAFIPGAFRPFGDHHMKMVRHYSVICDEVVIVVSNPQEEESERTTNLGSVITPKQSKEIIDLCLSDCGVENARCEISNDPNPVREILRKIALLKNCSVILGVGKKDKDDQRYDGIDCNYFDGNNVKIFPPRETAFSAVENEHECISASDIREHIDNEDMLRSYLPVQIEDSTFHRIYDILNGKSTDRLISRDELSYGSSIFQKLLEDEVKPVETDDECETQELDEEDTEYSSIVLDDGSINNSKCSIIAYNTHILEDGEDGWIYTPKSNPDRAIDVLFEFDDGNKVEIYLETETKEWNSSINGSQKLTPDQMGQFFHTDFCKRLDDRIYKMWPKSDPYFKELLDAVRCKKINCNPCGLMTEDGEFRKGNIDKNKSRGKNAAGKQIYTNSGRKIVTFTDFGVKHNEQEAYFCWPEKGKEFKWTQWADYKKIHPLIRMRFVHNSYCYGLSISPLTEDNENRGFRSYNLDLEPKLQYCTPIETEQMMDLTIVQKFLRNAYKRLKRFVDMDDEEIFRRINRPDKCEIGDIRKTKHMIRNSMKAIKERRADTYIYT